MYLINLNVIFNVTFLGNYINVDSTLNVNVHQRCFDVDIWFKMKVEPAYIYRRCFNIGNIRLKQRRYNYVNSTSIKQR